MAQLNVEQRMEVVAAWRSSGKTQEEFCRGHPAAMSARTLRHWERQFRRRPEESLRRCRAVLADAAREVSELLAAVDVALESLPGEPHTTATAPAAVGPCRAAEASAASGQSAPSAVVEDRALPRGEEPTRKPVEHFVSRNGAGRLPFDWEADEPEPASVPALSTDPHGRQVRGHDPLASCLS